MRGKYHLCVCVWVILFHQNAKCFRNQIPFSHQLKWAIRSIQESNYEENYKIATFKCREFVETQCKTAFFESIWTNHGPNAHLWSITNANNDSAFRNHRAPDCDLAMAQLYTERTIIIIIIIHSNAFDLHNTHENCLLLRLLLPIIDFNLSVFACCSDFHIKSLENTQLPCKRQNLYECTTHIVVPSAKIVCIIMQYNTCWCRWWPNS